MDKIIFLGNNYIDHNSHKDQSSLESTTIFLRPPSAFKEIKNQSIVSLPWERGQIHYSTEVVFKLYKKNIIGLGIGLNLTLIDIYNQQRMKSYPWEISKVFKNSALCSPIYGVRDFLNWEETPFTLKINGKITQKSKLSHTILKPNEMIHFVDKYLPICDGDLIYTGSSMEMGPLNPNDHLELQFGPIECNFKLNDQYE